ncbi:MAG: UDP-N-acetylmuramoyl-tripeptide--D-alanyl-D-alanine ligase [Nitrospirota bacterium]
MFTVEDILKATGGRLLRGEKGSVFSGVSIDSRTIKSGELFIALKGNRLDGHDFIEDAAKNDAAGVIISSPFTIHGSQLKEKAVMTVDDTLSALQKIAHYWRMKFDIPVVAVTGTNGKTTTKEMIASIIKTMMPVLSTEGNLNNHIGVPLTLLRLRESHRIAVIEMGMSNTGEIKRLCEISVPTIGVITNIGPAHLATLGNIENVLKAKMELAESVSDTLIINADDPYLSSFRLQTSDFRLLTFGFGESADVKAEVLKDIHLSLPGRHNIYNALASYAVAIALGIDIEKIKSGLESFKSVKGRSEILEIKGRKIINDSYNANPKSMESAIELLLSMKGNGKAVAVLGDMFELGAAGEDAHKALGSYIADIKKIDIFIAVGTLMSIAADKAKEAGMQEDSVLLFGDPEDVAEVIMNITDKGDTVLVKGSRAMAMERIIERIEDCEAIGGRETLERDISFKKVGV